MASLTNTKIKDTYDGLLKTTDNDALGGTYKLITDGLGNSSGVYLGTGGNVGIGQSSPTTYKLDVNGTFRAVSTAYFESGVNAASYIYHSGDTNTFFGFPANDTFTVTTNNSERMRIDSSGKVGIGYVPESGHGNFNTIITGASTARFHLGFGTNGDNYFTSGSNGIQVFRSDTTERMRINSSGNVGIGTTDPAELLTVSASDDVSIRINSTKDTAWTTNQKLGAFEFFGNDSSSSGPGLKGYINLTSVNQFGAAFNMNFGVGDNATDRMVIKYDGKVGIGTTDPQSKLHVSTGNDSNSGNIEFIIGGTNTSNSRTATIVKNTSSPYELQIQSGNHPTSNVSLLFKTSQASERMRIDSSGNVLIGTTSTNVYLNTTANDGGISIMKFSNGVRMDVARDNTCYTANRPSTTGAIFDFRQSANAVGNISVSTVGTSYNTSSDYRLKENVVDMTGALDRVEQLQPKRFNFISDAETTVDGFIAHEVQSVIPEAITGEKDAVDDEGNAEYQGIDQSKIVPLLVGAIKELKAEIETLKSQINS